MRTGRPQKTAQQKLLAGTAQPCRPRKEATEAEALKTVPDVPAWIEHDSLAVAEWKRLAPLLVANGTLAEQDLQTLANLCTVQSMIIQQFQRTAYLREAGLHAKYKQYGAALGLAHAWRSRVVKGEKDKPAQSPFEALKQWKPN